MKLSESLKPIVSLCKRRGFIYPGSEIYGGFANTYAYGPYGAQLKKNIKDLWWHHFVERRRDIVGLDAPILLHPTTWEASGHLESFNDALVDCRQCKGRFRADHLIEELTGQDCSAMPLVQMNKLLEKEIKCPKCGAQDFTEARHFNLMFHMKMNKTIENKERSDTSYLRPETAQAIFLEYKHILDTMRVKLPFGVAQIGKAFRNEITPGNFIFRTIEFEQMEIEYFIEEKNWQSSFDHWLEEMHIWCKMIGLRPDHFREKEHDKEQLSHYSKRTVDIIYDFPFGTQELYGLAYRTDFDLQRHSQYGNTSLVYRNLETKEEFIPHVIEPTFGLDRTILALLCEAYDEEQLETNDLRTVLRFAPHMAPVKAAVFPLMKKEPLQKEAQSLFAELTKHVTAEYDEAGAIGRRYRRQDELGTPFCITIDYQTLEDQTVTIRQRDSMSQSRHPIKEVVSYIKKETTFNP
jgi:glycyl-tRNA synthetase